MTLIIVLLFFKSICIYLQNFVLHCYSRFLNPRRKYYTSGPISGGGLYPHYRKQQRSSSSWWWFGDSLNQLRANEREQLLEKIRARKRAAKLKTIEPSSSNDWDDE